MQFTIDHMDAIFLGASDLNDLAKKSQMVKEMAVASGRKIKTYTMINLVIADTDEQAQAMVEHYREGFDEGAFRGVMRAYGVLDAEVGKENAFTRKARSGFISEYVAGSTESVGAHLMKILDDCDLDGLMLIFPDYLRGIPLFAQGILPRIRERFPHGHAQ